MKLEEVIDRRGTNSLKWDSVRSTSANPIPLWVADMDFPSPPSVSEALQERARHPIYGYTRVPLTYTELLASWYTSRSGQIYNSQDFIVAPGVMPSLVLALRALTETRDRCLVMPPVYRPFYPLIQSHDREVVECPLLRGDGGRYFLNWDELEKTLKRCSGEKRPIKALVFCSPHNPVGRVWTREELTRLALLAQEWDFWILSDEIHSDLLSAGQVFVSLLELEPSLRGRTVVVGGPCKTFNLAGLTISHFITTNKNLTHLLKEACEAHFFELPNVMSLTAAQAAYAHGAPWLAEVLQAIDENGQFLQSYFAEHLPPVVVTPREGTYLAWVDFSPLEKHSPWAEQGRAYSDDGALAQLIEANTGVKISPGNWFMTGGKGFLRFNLACPRPLLQQGLERLVSFLNSKAL